MFTAAVSAALCVRCAPTVSLPLRELWQHPSRGSARCVADALTEAACRPLWDGLKAIGSRTGCLLCRDGDHLCMAKKWGLAPQTCPTRWVIGGYRQASWWFGRGVASLGAYLSSILLPSPSPPLGPRYMPGPFSLSLWLLHLEPICTVGETGQTHGGAGGSFPV